MRGLEDIVNVLIEFVPPWLLYPLGAVIVLIAIPAWLKNGKSKRVKGLIRRMVRATPQQRLEFEEQAFSLAGEDKDLLYIVATEAQKRTFPKTYARAMEKLKQADGGAVLATLLASKTAAPPKQVAHPAESAYIISNMMEEGLTDAAKRRLETALREHPDAEELLVLKARLTERAPSLDTNNPSS